MASQPYQKFRVGERVAEKGDASGAVGEVVYVYSDPGTIGLVAVQWRGDVAPVAYDSRDLRPVERRP